MTTVSTHTWTFFRAGGLDQVQITTAADLMHLHELDQKLWVALSCPVKGLEFDSKTLELIDVDKDGRVRVPELLAALKWACGVLKDPAQLLKSAADLPLDAINETTPEGQSLLASARQVLINLGKPESATISVEDTSDTVRIFSETVFNGDGVVQAGCAKDPATKQVIDEIIAAYGSISDRSGKPGVNKEKLETFFAELTSFNGWWTAGEEASKPGSGVLPLGAATPAAFAAYSAMKNKINDWFTRCRLAAFDPRSIAHLNRAETDYQALAPKDLTTAGAEIAALPLQQIAVKKPLNLIDGVNPAWSQALAAFAALVIEPTLGAGKTTLSDDEWRGIMGTFAAYESWIGAKNGLLVEPLGIARVRAILASSAKADIQSLIDQDMAVAPQVASIDAIDRLARYHRDLFVLLRNFVNFADFYDRNPPPPIFIAGTLYLDQRSCELCIQVASPEAHITLASLAKCYIVYVACSRPSGEKITIAAAITQGDSDYLMVGRNGLFYDRKGRDWDATIVKLVDNPISIRQAFFLPYKKFLRMIEEQVAKRAAAADAESNAKLQSAATNVTNVDKTDLKVAKEPKKFDIGIVAALGVGVGAIGALLGGLISGFIGLGLWMPLGLIGIVMAISGPSMLIAWLKLRQRTLGPILEGNGWAINGRVKINIPLGTSLTGVKKLPDGSKRLLDDPFEDKDAQRRFRLTVAISIAVVVLAIAGWFGWHWYSTRTPTVTIVNTQVVTGSGTANVAHTLDDQAKMAEEIAAKPEASAEQKNAAVELRKRADEALKAAAK